MEYSVRIEGATVSTVSSVNIMICILRVSISVESLRYRNKITIRKCD